MKNLKKMLVVVAVIGFVVIGSASAAGTFTEDFENPEVGPAVWANGADGTLGGTGALTNGWVIRKPETWKIATVDNPTTGNLALKQIGYKDLNCYHQAGKAHGVDLGGTTSIEVSFLVQDQYAHDSFFMWMSDSNQNGYGLRGGGYAKNVRSNKYYGSTSAFGNIPDNQGTGESGRGGDAGDTATGPASWSDLGTYRYHYRLEQAAAGQAVTITVWYNNYDGTLTGTGKSYDTPLLTSTDNGITGSGVFNAAIFDLSDLTHVGFTCEWQGCGDGNPPTGYGVPLFDELEVTVIPEPATLCLLGIGGIGVLVRRRRV